MRPVRLDMNGFGSFREPTTVDFTDADYFALVGPTGSGKSTVIDAITFALYGSVSRWDNKKVIGWALAPTAVRGTVRLLFDVAGSRYVVARELRRAKDGKVTQKNGRLERFDDPTVLGAVDDSTSVLASDGEVTGAVEHLLGLTFDHFTQCVVLPQGEFAQFLHAKGAERRQTLLRLLGADIYTDIARAANLRAAAAGNRGELLADQIAQLGDATDEARAAAEQRVGQLAELSAVVTAALPQLTAATVDVDTAQVTAARLTGELQQLTSLHRPKGLDALDAELRGAVAALERAQTAEAAAQLADTAARDAVSAAPPRGPLEHVRRNHAELADVSGRLPAAREHHRGRETVAQEAYAASARADESLEVARAGRDAAATEAETTSSTVVRLKAELAVVRAVSVPDDLPVLETRRQAAQATVDRVAVDLAEAERDEQTAREALAAAPDRGPVELARSIVTQRSSAQTAVESLTRQRKHAEAAVDAAQAALDAAAERLEAARRAHRAASVAHSAAALRPHLQTGQPCPVCDQPVATLPAPADAPELAAVDDAVAGAEAAWRTAQQAVTEAHRADAVVTGQLTAARSEVDRLTARLVGLPDDPAQTEAQLARIEEVTAAERRAAEAVRGAHRCVAEARDELDAVERQGVALRAAFDAARDPLVALGAPTPVVASLQAAWTELADWAVQQAEVRRRALDEARTQAQSAAELLTSRETELTRADAELGGSRQAENVATAARERAAAVVGGLEERLAALTAALTGALSDADAEKALAARDRLEDAAKEADLALRTARGTRTEAQSVQDALLARHGAAWQALRAARDPLVPLAAPDLPDGPVGDAWTSLLDWARAESAVRREQAPAAEAAVAKANAVLQERTQKLVDALTAAGLTVPVEPVQHMALPTVAGALARAQADVDRIIERRARAATLAQQHRDAEAEQQVAHQLALLLRGDRFPEWLEAAALDSLVGEASASLYELSGGRFDLTHDKGEFFVVDHTDADSTRSVRTLSGGETFQASLALALALSSQLSHLAAAGAAKLDSIFLDEGFGSLDEASLEIVAATLENLAQGDRMVGLITHVSGLADRVPVRFVVSHDARTSTVVRELTG